MSRARPRKTPRPKPARRSPSGLRRAGDFAALALVGAHAGLLLLIWRDGTLPTWLGALFLMLAAATFLVYAHDKQAAQHEAARVPETRLHLLELAGGWPGALLAQRRLRHKNRKLSYQFGFWACALLHESVLLHLWRQLRQVG
ncbi:MAG: DUF1294 domain-containing protein [Pseudomonas sp.]